MREPATATATTQTTMEMEIINLYKSKTEYVGTGDERSERRMRAIDRVHRRTPASNDICKYAAAAGSSTKSYNILMMFCRTSVFFFRSFCAWCCLEVARAAYCFCIFFLPLILVFGSSWRSHTRAHTHIHTLFLRVWFIFVFFCSLVRFVFVVAAWVDRMRIVNNQISRWKWYFFSSSSLHRVRVVLVVLEMRMQNEISIKSHLNHLCVSLVYLIEWVLCHTFR